MEKKRHKQHESFVILNELMACDKQVNGNKKGDDKLRFTTDLKEIELYGKKKERENYRFRMHIKMLGIERKRLDKLVNKINDEVSRKIDCTKCANCCKVLRPEFEEEDIKRFAEGMQVDKEDLKEGYCEKVKGEKGKYIFKEEPCPFLRNNKCINYQHRPEVCASFPFLHKTEFSSRLLGIIQFYPICPIVFNVYEELKSLLWNQHWREHMNIYLDD